MDRIEQVNNDAIGDDVKQKGNPGNADKLRKLMEKYDMRVPDIAKLMGRSKWTVHHWLDTTGQSRPIPDEVLELLKLKLELKEANKKR